MNSCKVAIGCSRSRPTTLLPTCPPVSPILGASSNKAKEDSFTGKLLSVASDLEDLHGYEKPLDPFMPSFRDRRQPTSTFGKKIQESREPNLNSEQNPFEETKEEIGIRSGPVRLPGISEPFLPIYEYVVILHSRKSAKTTYNQLRWSAAVQFYGVQLAWESQGGLGMKLEVKLILRIRERSSGSRFANGRCGYGGQEHVIIDEFRGGIDIAHLLRWLDRYPVRVEVKGGSFPLLASRFWITSNIHPRQWYPDLDEATMDALLRRLTIINMISFP